jgi:hypothetical protein
LKVLVGQRPRLKSQPLLARILTPVPTTIVTMAIVGPFKQILKTRYKATIYSNETQNGSSYGPN